MVRKREGGSDSSGDTRSGVSYIKFSKASEAAKAIDEINGKVIGGSPKPIKVLVAADSSKDEVSEEELLRLFIKAPHEYTESQIRDHFSTFGSIEYYYYVRDKTTSKPKGFAYVKFFRFYDAARALEECNVAFKPVFAESRGPPPRRNGPPAGGHSGGGGHPPGNGLMGTQFLPITTGPTVPLPDSVSNPVFKPDATTCLKILCAKEVDERLLTLLCDIIPGFKRCDMKSPGAGEVNFNSLAWAQYAQEKLNGFEYPPGSRVVAKFTQTEATGNGHASRVESNDALFYPCSITLPPKEPVVPKTGNERGYVVRLFIVCSPRALASHVLLDVFCRFGNLIDVYILPGKTFGYAKYNCQDAANKCRTTLGGADVAGCRIKVRDKLLIMNSWS
jgi:RNA recognition motif-containing protein